MDLLQSALYPINKLAAKFFSLGSTFSLSSLLCALGVAVFFLMRKRLARKRRIRARTIARALFPRRILRSPSYSADVGYFFVSSLVFGLIFGWAILSFQVVSNLVIDGLIGAFGVAPPTVLPAFACSAIITLALFLAYELGYWFDHYLSHNVPVLWEFHKVHHSAEVLTPLTLFRVHPVDGLLNANILAITTGIANGIANYAFGRTTYEYAIMDTNLLFVLFVHAYIHLQHTHLWIAFRGLTGRVLLSPAHHQIHHSTNPAHFNKNLGSCLAIWDWQFGTLHVPAKEPERLTFGVEEEHKEHHHALVGSLVDPLWRVALQLKGAIVREAPIPVRADVAQANVADPVGEARPAGP